MNRASFTGYSKNVTKQKGTTGEKAGVPEGPDRREVDQVREIERTDCSSFFLLSLINKATPSNESFACWSPA